MTLEKDDAIIAVVDRLRAHNPGWNTIDHWEPDLCAIGICSPSAPGRIVYVPAYGNKGGLFDYECERENSAANLGYDVVDEGHHVPHEGLVAAIERHLSSAR